MTVPKINLVDKFVFLLYFCICVAVFMASIIDKSLNFLNIAHIVLSVAMILCIIYISLRMMSDLSLLKPTNLFARFRNGLGSLKRLDPTTRAWVIAIFSLCLLSMAFVFYISFLNAAGVIPYVIVTGVFTVTGIVFLFVIGKNTD